MASSAVPWLKNLYPFQEDPKGLTRRMSRLRRGLRADGSKVMNTFTKQNEKLKHEGYIHRDANVRCSVKTWVEHIGNI